MRFLAWIIVMICLVSWGKVESLEQIKEGKKVVLITGCSRGIGLATAECLAKNGYIVYATIRKANPLTSSSYKTLYFKLLDVTDSASIHNAVCEIIEKEGRLDVLINNAGYALGGPLESLSMQEILDQMDVNFFGVIRTCQEVLPYMRKQKSGHIINISSEQGVYGLPYGSLYTSSKAALESLSEALSIEVWPWNIFVSIVEPGQVATNFSVKLGTRKLEHHPYHRIREMIACSLQEKRIPSDSCQSAEEIALFLRKVIEESEPQLRYQTSKNAEEAVSKSIKDISGKEYSKRMKSLALEVYKEAWLDVRKFETFPSIMSENEKRAESKTQ